MEEACRRGLAGGLDFPEKGYKEKMAWGTRAKCSTVRWPTQRAAIADAARCDDTCTALHSPSHPQSPFATSRFFTTQTAPGICQNRLWPSHPPVRGSRFIIPAHPRGIARKCREARFEMHPSPFLSSQDNTAQGDTLGYTVFRQRLPSGAKASVWGNSRGSVTSSRPVRR